MKNVDNMKKDLVSWKKSILDDKKFFDELNKVYDKDVVYRLINNINSIKDVNYIIGYGSLMHKTDALRTMPNMLSHELAYIHGYQRVFNFGYYNKGSWLNVEKNACQNNMPVAIISLNKEDMLNFFIREKLYDNININATLNNEIINGVMVLVKDKSKLQSHIEPMLSYTNLCLQGIQNIGNIDDVNHFLNNSVTAYGKSLRDWYNDLDLLQYSLTHEHQTR